eukprot:NODE_295_length_10520_cov_1.134344.p6 type:complete len:147 gc:universal NODE_295_length_10520_cov_1.134344:8888-8448(-)
MVNFLKHQTMGQFQVFRQLGPLKYIKQLLLNKDPRYGKLVGEDRFGNKYYTGGDEFNRERFVIYKNKTNNYGGYDASQIPPEWHSWIHRISDTIPKPFPQLKKEGLVPFFETFRENVTLSEESRFKTKSTVPPKIQPWSPKIQSRK